MIDPAIPPMIDDIAARLEAGFGVKPSSLQRQLKTIGRDMPARYKRHARVLAQAEEHMGHPKLGRQVDVGKVQKAHAALVPFLENQNLADKRKGMALGMLGSLAVNLIILAVLLVVAARFLGLF